MSLYDICANCGEAKNLHVVVEYAGVTIRDTPYICRRSTFAQPGADREARTAALPAVEWTQQTFLNRCTDRQREHGNHGKPEYGGPCSQRADRCIQCVIEQAVEDLRRGPSVTPPETTP